MVLKYLSTDQLIQGRKNLKRFDQTCDQTSYYP